MRAEASIFVAGGTTLIGSALVRNLSTQGFANLINPSQEPDLTRKDQVESFFACHRPDYVFLMAGKSGGIAANQKYPADLAFDNLLVNAHILEAAHRHGEAKLLYLASCCCYPKLCPQPMQVEHLLTGKLEPTNEAYGLAKLAGIGLCQAYRRQYGACFIVGIPANVYGPGDNHDPADAHVITALLSRMHEAKLQGRKNLDIWGTGTPLREFIFVDDLAEACIFVMEHYDEDTPINLGSGQDFSIRELAEAIREVVGFPGELVFDTSKPDGMPRKSLDSRSLLEMGWRAKTTLREGLQTTYQWFLAGEEKNTTR